MIHQNFVDSLSQPDALGPPPIGDVTVLSYFETFEGFPSSFVFVPPDAVARVEDVRPRREGDAVVDDDDVGFASDAAKVDACC
ncbi:hypothetical protein [Filomicrobium insigne]|uniref:hypothetical protein n=1 Tax=Filomicrobium insigne TaxID=418854 RepID=UPI000B802D55|nr:hypothetical protein [Filomicrobium insigne]